MSAQVFTFVSRGDQVALRGMRNFAQWNHIRLGIEPCTPQQSRQITAKQAEDRARDKDWARRHHPLPEGVSILTFKSDRFTTGGLDTSSHGTTRGG